MDIHKISDLLNNPEAPVGLGGCRNENTNYECCEYNVTLFDGKLGESIHNFSGELVKLHHCSISENDMGVLTQIKNLTVLRDGEWKLRMLLSKLKEKNEMISKSYAQSCLVDAGIFANKTRDAIRTNDPFASIWIKCACYFLADALFSINSKRPSPTHMLDTIRNFKKNDLNQSFSLIHQILGIERTSITLLSRMVKSTVGFSDIVEANGNSEIIKRKYDYLVENSLLSDCYFYLGYINRNNVMKTIRYLHHKPEYFHVLRVAFDVESDHLIIGKQVVTLLQRINEIVSGIKDQK